MAEPRRVCVPASEASEFIGLLCVTSADDFIPLCFIIINTFLEFVLKLYFVKVSERVGIAFNFHFFAVLQNRD